MTTSTIDLNHFEQVETLRISCIIFVVFVHVQAPWEHGLQDQVPYLLFYVCAPIAVLLLSGSMIIVLEQISPELLSILSGGQLGRGSHSGRKSEMLLAEGPFSLSFS